MSIGTQPTKSGLDNQATSIVLQLRTAFQNVQAFTAYLQSLGEGGLTSLGYTSDDVTALVSIFVSLDSVRVMVGGGAAPEGTPLNFVEQTIPLWAGQ
jgi:hypothetical protein